MLLSPREIQVLYINPTQKPKNELPALERFLFLIYYHKHREFLGFSQIYGYFFWLNKKKKKRKTIIHKSLNKCHVHLCERHTHTKTCKDWIFYQGAGRLEDKEKWTHCLYSRKNNKASEITFGLNQCQGINVVQYLVTRDLFKCVCLCVCYCFWYLIRTLFEYNHWPCWEQSVVLKREHVTSDVLLLVRFKARHELELVKVGFNVCFGLFTTSVSHCGVLIRIAKQAGVCLCVCNKLPPPVPEAEVWQNNTAFCQLTDTQAGRQAGG